LSSKLLIGGIKTLAPVAATTTSGSVALIDSNVASYRAAYQYPSFPHDVSYLSFGKEVRIVVVGMKVFSLCFFFYIRE
jgi:hypothetical protein